jgi:hypothetical protein
VKDFAGKELSLGDEVVMPVKIGCTTRLKRGIICGFSEKRVRVEYMRRSNKQTFASFEPNNLVKI